MCFCVSCVDWRGETECGGYGNGSDGSSDDRDTGRMDGEKTMVNGEPMQRAARGVLRIKKFGDVTQRH